MKPTLVSGKSLKCLLLELQFLKLSKAKLHGPWHSGGRQSKPMA
jgi:hypothetical protein